MFWRFDYRFRHECLDHMAVFSEHHLRRILSLYADQCGSSGEPFVAMMQSADPLSYGDDTYFFFECTKATLVPLASRLYCGQILTKEGAA